MAFSARWQDTVNRYTLTNTVEAVQEPVSLAEMKNHLRVDFTDDDDLILTLIAAARQEGENQCRRIFISSTWVLSMDHFPSYGYIAGYGAAYTGLGDSQASPVLSAPTSYQRGFYEFPLPVSPVQSVTGITYTDSNGAVQTLDSSLYDIDLMGYPATLTPAYGQGFPTIRTGRNGVQITFVAGYGDPSQVPAAIKAWMKYRVATAYRNRESVVLFRGTIQELEFVDRMLDPYRIIEIA